MYTESKENGLLKAVILAVVLLFTGIIPAYPAVWQWSVLVRNAKNNNGKARAFLWVPDNCKRVKTVVFAQNNMEEQSILENKQFREDMGKLGVAEVWVSPGSDLQFLFTQGAGEAFDAIMEDLAEVSGYTELKYTPVAYMGHSAAASAPYYFAAYKPERTLAAISVSGQWPYVRNNFAPDIWDSRNIDYIPSLETMGEYEAANTWSREGLKERLEHPLTPLTMLSNPAQGHFAATDKKINFIALYIKKAMQYRLPKQQSNTSGTELVPIDPTKTGWLVDKWRYNEEPLAAPAPVGKYKGNPAEAFWCFDEELANAITDYQAAHRHQKPQLVGYVQNGKMVEQRNTHQQVNLRFEPEEDGITFKLHAAFYDTVPGGSPRPRVWAESPVGSKIGHAGNENTIAIDWITGPFIKLNDSTFRIQLDKGIIETVHSFECWFAATHPGDNVYKPAVQQSQMLVPPRNTEGMDQHITFPVIPDQKRSTKAVKLSAVSDAKVPVHYFVREGPAEIKEDKVVFTAIPPGSRLPVKVTVVAWQYGKGSAPKLKTADQVERTFLIR